MRSPRAGASPADAVDTDRSLFRKAKFAAINVFLAFHIVSIACWCLPVESPLLVAYKRLVSPYFAWSGLFQSWDMFAPIPKAANTSLEAVVIYQDGTRTTWTFPRMEQLGFRDRYFEERYRKFADMLQQEENDVLRSEAARYIARQNSTPARPVKTVILIQKYSFMVPRADGRYIPEPWEQHVLLGYGVQAEDLR